MQESSVVLDNSAGSRAGVDGGGGAAASAAEEVVVLGENGGGAGDGGNRWPREETLALLKIRSEMDLAFRDATLKAPLWDEVSRKLGELGYHRSARKCKEKFENIFKYHRRTKECRSGRQNGKNYKYFEQLVMFDNQSSLPSPSTNQIQPYVMEMTSITEPTVMKPVNMRDDFVLPCPTRNPSMEFVTPSTSTTSSSGRDSGGSVKRKRKLIDYFEKLMKEVLEKQENLQNQLLDALEKCERDRIAREEAWRIQQMDRLKREQEFLAQERAVAAAKDAAVMEFLQKVSEQTIPLQFPGTPAPTSEKQPLQAPTPLPIPIPSPKNIDKQDTALENGNGKQDNASDKDTSKQGNAGSKHSFQLSTSLSRWPKAEVEALIEFRTDLGLQYQDNGLKGPLWEEIACAMKKLGYNRNAKRCKEKWENINKYYKRVKESNKKRPESSKTCPYFDMLEALYERKSKVVELIPDLSVTNIKPEDILMQKMSQQQQQQQHLPQAEQSLRENGEQENVGQNGEDEPDEEEEDDDNGEDYQLVANNPCVASLE